MGQPIVREISAGDLFPDSDLKNAVSTNALNASAASAGSNTVANIHKAIEIDQRTQDWELAFWRSEMLRRFKTDLLGNLGHELRSPLSSQLGSLDLVLSGLCESQAEIQEFLGAARQSAQNHLQLIVDCIALSRYESPVLPFSARVTSLAPALGQVERLLLPIATDRGLRLEWSIRDVDVFADPHGCEQIVLGLGMWSLGQLLHGTLVVTVEGAAEKMRDKTANDDSLDRQLDKQLNKQLDSPHQEGTRIVLTTTGQLRQDSPEREALYWQVPRMMLEAMGGRLFHSRDGDRQQIAIVQFPPRPNS